MIGKLSFFLSLPSSSRWSTLSLGESTLLALHTQLAIRNDEYSMKYLSISYVLSTDFVLGSIAMKETVSTFKELSL